MDGDPYEDADAEVFGTTEPGIWASWALASFLSSFYCHETKVDRGEGPSQHKKIEGK